MGVRYDYLVTFLHWPNIISDNKDLRKRCNVLGILGGRCGGENGTGCNVKL